MATPATTAKSVTKSGFFSSQFWVGFVSVVGAFVLGQYGNQLGQLIPQQLLDLLGGQKNITAGLIVVGLVALFISVSSWLETRGIRINGTAAAKTTKGTKKPFYQTSEFWLGLITVVLNYLHDTGTFAPDVTAYTSTTTVVVALIYTFARSRLKDAYDQAAKEGN